MTQGQLIGVVGLALLAGAGACAVLGIRAAGHHGLPSNLRARFTSPRTRNYILGAFGFVLAAVLLVTADMVGFAGL